MTGPTLIVFLGGLGSSPAELLVANARRAAALDTVEAALSTGAFDRGILATDNATFAAEDSGERPFPFVVRLSNHERSEDAPVTVDLDDHPFHFGSRLAGLIRRTALDHVVYLGGGSVPLFTAEDFRDLAKQLTSDTAITNNAYSSDLVAFAVGERVLEAIAPIDRDNALARALEEHAGLALRELPRTVATQMDIDAPSDLAVLALTGEAGPRLREYLRVTRSSRVSPPQAGTHRGTLALDLSRYQRTLPFLTEREAQILVAGRVGSHAWQYLERETACRVRLFAEERGLESDDRAAMGTAHSLLGFLIEAAGLDRFFELLPQLGDAAFIDTRVLLAHFRIDATREDRFLSDLGDWKHITEPFLHDFTRAAIDAPIPVLLGGHSLMSGGLMALNEHVWREHEARQSNNPIPPSS